MSDAGAQRPQEVEQLLLNARLRDELEPFFDESISRINTREMPTPTENEFLASMLAWERAPALPISQWFTPELVIPAPAELDDEAIHARLWEAIERLHEARIALDFTDHLSDRQLYTLIYRDILPSYEKKLDLPEHFLHWNCADAEDTPDAWLRYYASDEEREGWSESQPLPPKEVPPYPRVLPRGG